jgi:hypothetical protein
MVVLCRDAIRAGHLKVLVPFFPFPTWGYSTLQTFGISPHHIVSVPAELLRCNCVLVADTLTTLNTYLPNPELCRLAATALGIDIATRWTSRNAGSRI